MRAQRANGKSVIMATECYKSLNNDVGELLVAGMLPLLKKLMIDLQVVVVITAGSEDEPYTDIVTYPAAFAHAIDIITVGSVIAEQGEDNGKRYPSSPGGEALMISGPGNGRCIGSGSGDRIFNIVRHNMATASVAGLVAYFLALPDLGKLLRRNKRTSKNVLDYLQLMSWKRYAAQESVWNGPERDILTGSVFRLQSDFFPPQRFPSFTLVRKLARV